MSKMIKHAVYVFVAALLAAAIVTAQAHAMEQVLKPFQGPRSSAMGGTKIMTGFYEENFWANPARVTANPKWRVQIFDPMIETTTNTTDAFGLVGGDLASEIGNHMGKNLHLRVQTTFPGVYLPYENWSYAFAILTSTQADFNARKSYNLRPEAVIDIGPAFTVGRKLLPNKNLSVGGTLHANYRATSRENFTTLDFFQGASLAPTQNGDDAMFLDFDLGSTFQFPFMLWGFNFSTGLAMNNVLGGDTLKIWNGFYEGRSNPRRNNRMIGAGFSMHRKTWWKFSDFIVSLEATDIANNKNGSIFRLIHLGTEIRWKVLIPRFGINQGYLAGGLGVDVGWFILDLATYGEEMTLNVGQVEDRRYAMRLAFQI